MKFETFLLLCDNDELLHVYFGKNTLDCESVVFARCCELITHHKYYDYKVNTFFSDRNYHASLGDDTLIEVYITKE